MNKNTSRFVILFHQVGARSDRDRDHWDLMIAAEESLKTWAIEQEPRVPSVINAVQLPDHRLEYLDYEGKISADRGYVTKWDEGQYTMKTQSDDLISVELTGRKLNATLELARISGNQWQLCLKDAGDYC